MECYELNQIDIENAFMDISYNWNALLFLKNVMKNILQFQGTHLQAPVPFVIYADFESIIVPLDPTETSTDIESIIAPLDPTETKP